MTKPYPADLHAFAERELGAFLAAVSCLFGPGEAQHAADDWLDELESRNTLPAVLAWRSVTIAAAVRMAERLHRGGNRGIDFISEGGKV